jgi:hypothetical protein
VSCATISLLVIAGEGDAGDDYKREPHKNGTKSLTRLTLYLLVIAGEGDAGDDGEGKHQRHQAVEQVIHSGQILYHQRQSILLISRSRSAFPWAKH